MKNKHLKNGLANIAQRGIPDDTNLWPKISAKIERSTSMMQNRPRPFAAIFLAGLSLLVMSGVVYALGRTLGYTPGLGLVDNSAGIRMLAEPVSVTRDGVTLTVSSVIAYDDRVDLVYDVDGAALDNDSLDNAADLCGSGIVGGAGNTEGDARLQLPDGTVLERDHTGKYPQNAFAMKPVYAASLPAEVSSLTFLLDCIPQAQRGAAPEDWVVPLELTSVPAGTTVGAPVIEVEPEAAQPKSETAASDPQAAALPTRAVTMNLSKIVPLDTATVFYFSLDMDDKDASLVSIMPVSVSVIDSQGQKIRLIGNFTWQPFEHRVGSEFEFTSETKPADGPLTLVVENAVAYYAPLYVEPQQATSDEMSFTFDAGANPQYGQTWDLDESFEIAGYPVRVTSARAGSIDDLKPFDLPGDSQGYDYGYDFTVETDPSVKMQVMMDLASESTICGPGLTKSYVPASSSYHDMPLCQAYPTGSARATIMELSVLVEDTWQVVWEP